MQQCSSAHAEQTACKCLCHCTLLISHSLAPFLPHLLLPRQYPGLQEAVAADLATMLTLADASNRLFPATSWRWLFEELRRQGVWGLC